MKRYIKSNEDLSKSQLNKMKVADRIELANNTSDSVTIELLANDPSSKVRRIIAKKAVLQQNSKLVKHFAADSDSDVRMVIAQYTRDPDIRSQLLHDPSSNVRRTALRFAALYGQADGCIEAIRALVDDPSWKIRKALAYEARYFEELHDLLDTLVDDDNPQVRNEAQQSLNYIN